MSQRQRDGRKGPTPRHAPNFQTGDFRSKGFQSTRGQGYQPAGEDVLGSRSQIMTGMSDYQQRLSNRNNQMKTLTRPKGDRLATPDFQRMTRPLRKQITI